MSLRVPLGAPAHAPAVRGPLALLLLLGLVAGWGNPVPCRASVYNANAWYHCNNSYLGTPQFSDTDPVEYTYTDQPAAEGYSGYQSGHGRSDRGFLEVYSDLQTNSRYSSCSYCDGYWDSASLILDDLVFTCAGGQPSISASMRLRVQGSSVLITPAPPTYWAGGASMTLSGMAPDGGQVGVWTTPGAYSPPGGTPEVPPSSGLFASETGTTIDGIFVGPSFTVPTGVPISIGFGASVIPAALVYGGMSMRAAMNMQRIGFPDDRSPAFELPSGCSCNSLKGDIHENVWGPPTAVNPPVSQAAWGRTKALYR